MTKPVPEECGRVHWRVSLRAVDRRGPDVWLGRAGGERPVEADATNGPARDQGSEHDGSRHGRTQPGLAASARSDPLRQ